VTKRIKYPSEQHVREVLRQMEIQAHCGGRRPSTLALARQLGLPNTSFRRAFPDVAREISTRAQNYSAGFVGDSEAGCHGS